MPILSHNKLKTPSTRLILKRVVQELHSLRKEFSLLLPNEDIKDYTDGIRIKRSYQRAIKTHPPVRL